MSLLVGGASQVATPRGTQGCRGEDLGRLEVLPGAVVRCDDGVIAFVGSVAEHDRRFPPADEVFDAGGGCILPGFVDPHTHPVWAGSREDELTRRLRGESYMDIARSGGGINATVRATRAASFAALLDAALASLTAEQREAFVMKHVEGRSYEEMAGLLGVGIDALKMRVHRARDALKEQLGGRL